MMKEVVVAVELALGHGGKYSCILGLIPLHLTGFLKIAFISLD